MSTFDPDSNRTLKSYQQDRWCGTCKHHGFKPGSSRNWCKITDKILDQDAFWEGCSYWADRMEKHTEDEA